MDARLRSHVLKELRGLENDARHRLILTITEAPHDDIPAIDPANFPDRVSYRKALIAKLSDEKGAKVDDAVSALLNLGLSVVPARLTGLIVVEGTIAQLESAISLPHVERAVLDQELRIIPPEGI